jgi:hypothetical protein
MQREPANHWQHIHEPVIVTFVKRERITQCVNSWTLFIQGKWTGRGQAANEDMPQV